MTIRLEVHAEDAADARWRATADVDRADVGPTLVKADQYGGYGSTPLEAAMKLSQTLANVIGYERLNGVGAADRPGCIVCGDSLEGMPREVTHCEAHQYNYTADRA